MSDWPGPIFALTIFAEDLETTTRFYTEVFGLPVVFRDANSAVFQFGETLINLLDVSQADGLVGPAPVAPQGAGARFQLTLKVDDVDATCAELERRGVRLLNGPVDRPWGPRTAAFQDPTGTVWEIAS